MGMLNRLFGNPNAATENHLLNLETAQMIVEDYGNFLQASAPLPGCVADTSRLPHDKDIIKDALLTCMGVIRDPGLIEHLKHGYLMLSAWQEGVGEKHLGIDFTQLNLEADPLQLAASIQRQKETVDKWEIIISAEQAALKSDLRELLL